jgi:hypothetical protein
MDAACLVVYLEGFHLVSHCSALHCHTSSDLMNGDDSRQSPNIILHSTEHRFYTIESWCEKNDRQ